MSYLILCDSCTDFTEDMKQDPHFAHIPLTIHIGDYDIIDDDTFDQQDFLRRIDAYPECAKSSCPHRMNILNTLRWLMTFIW